MWSVLAHPEKMLKAARGCLWWTLIVTLQTLTSCLETLHHFISSTGLTREETKLSAEAGRFTRQVLIHNKPNLQVNMLHWQLLTFSHQHSARISGNLQRWNWFLGACEEKCEPISNQERRERGREAEWRERGESGKVMAGFPAVFEGNQRPKQRGTGINRYILCDVGKGWKCVCMSCMCVFVCIFMCVCVCVVWVFCPSSALSDGHSKFFQHTDSFLLVLLPGQPEVVLVLHDVGQHGSTQEHHVLSPGRILNPDLKFLQEKKHRGEWWVANTAQSSQKSTCFSNQCQGDLYQNSSGLNQIETNLIQA